MFQIQIENIIGRKLFGHNFFFLNKQGKMREISFPMRIERVRTTIRVNVK